jgi:hypothetical protein
MLDSLILNMEVKASLKLMASIRPDHADPERKFLNHIIDKFDSTILVVIIIDLQSPNMDRIVNRCVLISPYRLTGSNH